jgi:hypothetical protein
MIPDHVWQLLIVLLGPPLPRHTPVWSVEQWQQELGR